MSILRLTNFEDHPGDHRYLVFRFQDPKMAGEFMDELTMAAIPFEEDETNEGRAPYLIGVKKQFRERAVKLNYTVIGRYREPFISDAGFRWFLIAFVGFVLLLAVLGWLNRP
jgi:hypothetical protein